jgi:Tfp pilus assembly protein PilO
MARNFTPVRRFILAGLALLVAADIALAVYSWRNGSSPSNSRSLSAENDRLKLLRADVDSAKRIQRDMPTIQKDCDRFLTIFFPASTGYSSISADLDTIANKSGLQIVDRSFKQKENAAYGLTKVDISATVSGTYETIVHFVNGLQRSQNLYDVEGLNLAGDAQNPGANSQIKVTLQMHTYFRAGA